MTGSDQLIVSLLGNSFAAAEGFRLVSVAKGIVGQIARATNAPRAETSRSSSRDAAGAGRVRRRGVDTSSNRHVLVVLVMDDYSLEVIEACTRYFTMSELLHFGSGRAGSNVCPCFCFEFDIYSTPICLKFRS